MVITSSTPYFIPKWSNPEDGSTICRKKCTSYNDALIELAGSSEEITGVWFDIFQIEEAIERDEYLEGWCPKIDYYGEEVWVLTYTIVFLDPISVETDTKIYSSYESGKKDFHTKLAQVLEETGNSFELSTSKNMIEYENNLGPDYPKRIVRFERVVVN